jgi:Asp-tRNA(Asn)/Glu-tRNA(Gln) amidotransferase A subunit family amidase
MLFDIELTQKAPNRYIARVLLLPDVVVEATSRSEALDRVRAAIRAREKAGVEIVQVAIDDETRSPSAWRKHAGAFPDDELYDQMLDDVRRNRAELDTDTTP